MLTRDLLTFQSNICAKTNNFAKLFLPVHMGPGQILLRKKNNGRTSRDFDPLRMEIKAFL